MYIERKPAININYLARPVPLLGTFWMAKDVRSCTDYIKIIILFTNLNCSVNCHTICVSGMSSILVNVSIVVK